ncbi:MAG: dihydropteroate synthase [Acidobacteria bacterium]|nr:dihydropteroate synthase [Acidobacteriota bacterium]
MTPRASYRLPLPGGRVLDLGERTLVMAILNITPDSFSDGGTHLDVDRAVAAGLRMVAEGADILDIGGESTRPGAESVGADEELRRVLPVVEKLAFLTSAVISIDTYKAVVGREAVARGATMINDISGLLYDPGLATVAAETGAALILMHTRGRSHEMYELAVYDDVVTEVRAELESAVTRARSAGVPRDRIILDPGFGFAKRPAHSYALLARLPELAVMRLPVLSGPSRKSFLKEPLGDRLPGEREWGTAAAVTASVLGGAHIVRVHHVPAMVDVVRVADRIRTAAEGPG